MKPVLVIIGALALVGVLLLTGLFVLLGFLFDSPGPDQPKFGFTGDWRSTSVFGFEERPLPPAGEVWTDYKAWPTGTIQHGSRLYLAHLGGSASQSGFRSWVSSGDTPLGAQQYTNVEFSYTDATNGTYILSWVLRGEHDTSFLQFSDSFRLFQLHPFGGLGETPPRLSIIGIEGIKPEHYVKR